MKVTLPGLFAIALPWALSAPAEAPAAEVHTVKDVVGRRMADAMDAFVPAWKRAGEPRMGLLVLGPGQRPFETWRLEVLGLAASDGPTSVRGREALPALPVAGWRARAASELEAALVRGGVTVIDLAAADWASAAPTADQGGDASARLPADVVIEVRYVPRDPVPQTRVRALRLKDGALLAVAEAPVGDRSDLGFAAATRKATAEVLEALTQRW